LPDAREAALAFDPRRRTFKAAFWRDDGRQLLVVDVPPTSRGEVANLEAVTAELPAGQDEDGEDEDGEDESLRDRWPWAAAGAAWLVFLLLAWLFVRRRRSRTS
jgi:hypothetical protein